MQYIQHKTENQTAMIAINMKFVSVSGKFMPILKSFISLGPIK
jgi:hypothetical protein